MSAFEFKLKDYTKAEVPQAEVAAGKAIELAQSLQKDWTKGKVYKFGDIDVNTFHHRIEGDYWMARVSYHKDVSFDTFRASIYENHTENEVKYIPLLDSFKILEDPVKGHEAWRSILVHYKFPKLFSDREMAIWITAVELDPSKKQFVVVSLPSVEAVSPDVTRATYTSFEVITYDAEKDQVEWVMAQTSDSRGSIPRWVQDRAVTGSVVEDVPHFIKWAKQQRQS